MNLELKLLQVCMILKPWTEHVYFVGGSVRDALLGLRPKDYDIVTDLSIDDVNAHFEIANWKVKNVGKNFLVTVVSKDGYQFEIARFRTEHGFTDGRRPDLVAPGTMQQDADRRDFTINALYFDPFTNQVTDFHGGLDDLRKGVLKFIGDPVQRIEEDYLRVFRCEFA